MGFLKVEKIKVANLLSRLWLHGRAAKAQRYTLHEILQYAFE